MFLKRVEIQGFKSFADKVDFQINPGVTIVVGPNGSGKSNISDALRWVMGEQSAKSMRGAKMEDIIFAGSHKRKALGLAEVNITFDNSQGLFPLEFNEVTITRRLYRSGESDFLINKSQCRLKDIHELFMDTGVGKDTYSIIGQGKVEEIINSKAEERRSLIEEAAGIVKYKTRKNEAIRKLNATEQDLLRIYDILGELSEQIGPLEEQDRVARAYHGLAEELRELEIALLSQQIEDQRAKLTQLKEHLVQLLEETQACELSLHDQEAEKERDKLVLNEQREKLDRLMKQYYSLKEQIQTKEKELELAEERIKGLAKQRDQLKEDIGLSDDRLGRLDVDNQDNLERLKQITEEIQGLSEAILKLESDRDGLREEVLAQEYSVEASKGDIIELLNTLAEYKFKLSTLEKSREDLEKRKEENNQKTKELNEELTALGDKGKSLNLAGEKSFGELESAQATLKKIEEKLSSLQQEFKDTQQAIFGMEKEINTLASRQQVLKEMEEALEGYQRGVKELIKAKAKGIKECNDICDVIGQIINVEQKYEIAIEVALGGALQNIVTNTAQGAKEAINYLKRQNLGRATFLPIDSVSKNNLRPEEEKLLGKPGVLGIAANLVTSEGKYHGVINNLLGRIIVVDNMDTGLGIAKASGFRVKIVTLEGEVINPGGSMTGGSLYKRQDSSLLGRSRELSEIAKRLNIKQESLNGLVCDQQAIENSLNENQQAKDEVLDKIKDLQIRVAELERDRVLLEQEKARIAKESEIWGREEKQYQEKLELNLRESEFILSEKERLEKEHSTLETTVLANQQNLKQKVEHLNVMEKEITELKISLAARQQEEQGIRLSLGKYYESHKEFAGEIKSKERLVKELEAAEASNRMQIEELLNSRDILMQQLAVFETELQREQDQLELLNKEYLQKEQSLKAAQQKLLELRQTLHNAEVREARLQVELDNTTNRLWETYELTYEQALLQRTDIPADRKSSNRVKELKREIEALGTVNLGAIEEYQRVKERHDFLHQQASDLQAGKESLYKVIDEINQIMTGKFAETFKIIKENFEEVFAKLFGGGKAELVLTEPDNLLDTGVDMIAQPPGKKPQHLSLLSGGEKALTAISLLFAILKFKPSPFCVLDEIEAALDEANVRRFADFVKEFSERTQFIVVTHRKGTMEVADILYGVTMDESGVSKVVSMKLEDKVEDKKELVS